MARSQSTSSSKTHVEHLTPALLVRAYASGLFPMARSRRSIRIDWYSPDPRAVLPLEPAGAFHVSHSLRKRVRRGDYLVTCDRAFARVVRACAKPRPREEQTWINSDIIGAYTQLHEMGLAHSVEAWLPPPPPPPPEVSPEKPALLKGCKLVGGLYGVSLGGAFFGESMFSSAPDASKVCLVHLVARLRDRGYALLDCQISNPHMEQFGVVDIPRGEYLERLAEALKLRVNW